MILADAAPSSVAGVITAIAATFTALALVITALSVLVPTLRQVRKVHTIVNQQRTDLLRYQRALVIALKNEGIDIPVDQSIDTTDDLDVRIPHADGDREL